LAKTKEKELTVNEVKDMIYKAIQKKQKAVDPEKFNTRIVEDNLAEVEAMHAADIRNDFGRRKSKKKRYSAYQKNRKNSEIMISNTIKERKRMFASLLAYPLPSPLPRSCNAVQSRQTS
jgi:hypothetical protein